MVFLDAHTERDRVLGQVNREVVLQLVAVIKQLVVRRERLESECRIIAPALQNLYQRKPRPFNVLAALVARVVPDDDVVGLVAEGRVPLANDGSNVLEDRVVRIGEIQREIAAPPVAQTQR